MLWKTIEYPVSAEAIIFRISGPARPTGDATQHDEFTFQVTNSYTEGTPKYELYFEKELLREDLEELHNALGEFLK